MLYYSILYFFYIFMFVNFNSVLMYWLFMEFNLIFFILFITQTSDCSLKVSMEQSFYYLVIQSLGSLMFLFSFLFQDFFSILFMNSNFLILVSLSMKMGIFPFHFWVYKFSKYSSNFILFLILTIQKIPVILILFTLNSIFVQDLLLFNLILGSIYLLFSASLQDLLVSSSLYMNIWFFIFFLISPILFLFIFLNYTVFIFNLIKLSLFSSTGSSSLSYLVIVSCILFFLGLPPLGMFFYKFFSMNFLISYFPVPIFFLIWVFTFMSTIGYFIYFLPFLFKTNFLYNNIILDSKKIFFFLIMIFLFFLI